MGFVFLWFFLGGIAHFAATEAELRIVPSWIAWSREAVLASGVFELLGAFGLLWRPVRRAAGWGLVLLTIAVTPANVVMLQHAVECPAVPYWLLVARLPFQAVLIGLTVWGSAMPRGRAPDGSAA
ncbi:DoxX family protein [Xylophilus sp.]|uniref:DoxX family protein n=1 Tax=Xylophilus sp. TaxID=2653893 RepID=UPI0013B9300F|nr:hypothetical protein [Xylophilus sp.]KAF1046985.1 MAG: hypothetical protein GAK38_02202 [Xylophilus sp.]